MLRARNAKRGPMPALIFVFAFFTFVTNTGAIACKDLKFTESEIEIGPLEKKRTTFEETLYPLIEPILSNPDPSVCTH